MKYIKGYVNHCCLCLIFGQTMMAQEQDYLWFYMLPCLTVQIV